MTRQLRFRRAMGRSYAYDWAFVLLPLLVAIVLSELWGVPYVRPVNLDDPSVRFPLVPEIVPAIALIAFAVLVPTVVFLLCECRLFRDPSALSSLAIVFFLGLFESCGFTILFTSVLKLIVGRPRPFFAAVCEAYVQGSNTLCTGKPSLVKVARKSFPSGHSSLSFASMLYLTFYLAVKLRILETRHSARTWKFTLLSVPLFAAALIAVSRTIDYRHHYADVVAGALLGSAIGAAVWTIRKDQLRGCLNMASEYEPLPVTSTPSQQI